MQSCKPTPADALERIKAAARAIEIDSGARIP